MPPDPTPTNEEVTLRLEELMNRLQIRNRSLMAERLGYSRSQLYAIEKGEVPITKKFLISLDALERESVPGFKVQEDPFEGDAVARLLRGLDFPSLCGVMDAGVTTLKKQGKPDEESLRQIIQAANEMRRRAGTVKYF